MERARLDPDGATCRIFAVVEAGTSARERLDALFAQHPLTSVLFVPTKGQVLTAALKPLVELVQSKNCAALLADDAALARTLRADGVHLTATAEGDALARYAEARSIVGSGAIVGVDAGASRHVAMELGEAGADYVAFGASAGTALPAEENIENVGPSGRDGVIAWWAEVFEVPCVALDVMSHDEAADLAACGADFVALDVGAGEPMATAVARLKAYIAAVEGLHAL